MEQMVGMDSGIPRHWCDFCGEPVRLADSEEHIRREHPEMGRMARGSRRRLAIHLSAAFLIAALAGVYGLLEGGGLGRIVLGGGVAASLLYGVIAHRLESRALGKALEAMPYRCPICDDEFPRKDFLGHIRLEHGRERWLFRFSRSTILGTGFVFLGVIILWLGFIGFGLLGFLDRQTFILTLLGVASAAGGVLTYVVVVHLPRGIAQARDAYDDRDSE